ncbi:MAG: thrombospondin type 3 repeat-containing protein, partial [Saprospiraceae bacterium]|nr:thrombospondin type 3 repeat-containing protein [Saprospiraceae bacterium]
MKKPILVLTLFFAFLLSQKISAQELTPHGLAAKVLIIDYGVPNSIDTLGVTNGLELSYFRSLSSWANLSIPLRIGVAEIAGNRNKITTFGMDATIQFPFFPKATKLSPYLVLGGGFSLENFDEAHLQFPIGIGANIFVGKNGSINLQAAYRKATLENRDNLEFGLGYLLRFQKKDPNQMSDRDGDTIPDEMDKCPDEPGHVTAEGCPDRDGDTVTDVNDSCPDEAGKPSAGGCPDEDEDGIADKFDDCPQEPGPAATKGCPDKDKDGDGIVDEKDHCPEEPGSRETDGCPDSDGDGVADKYDLCNGEMGTKYTSGCPDTDQDGIADKFDDCPNLAGPPERKGCPMKDEDGDGVIDSADDCPTVKGPAASNGCPDTDGDGLHDGIDRCPTAAGDPLKGGCPEISKEIKD